MLNRLLSCIFPKEVACLMLTNKDTVSRGLQYGNSLSSTSFVYQESQFKSPLKPSAPATPVTPAARPDRSAELVHSVSFYRRMQSQVSRSKFFFNLRVNKGKRLFLFQIIANKFVSKKLTFMSTMITELPILDVGWTW